MNETPVVEISPLSKGKRALSFLAEFFLTFILGLSLFHLAIYPLGKLAVGYTDQAKASLVAQEQRDSVLYGHQLLFAEAVDKHNPGSFSSNLELTYKAYLYQFVKDRPEINVTYDQYAGEVFTTYYQNIRGGNVLDFYRNLEGAETYFTITDTVNLKAVYSDEFIHAYIKGDEMSSQGQQDYEDFENKVFLKGYNRMLNDIAEKDLIFEGVSYRESQQKVSAFIALEKNLVLASALIAYALSSLILSLLIPLFIKRRRTLSMLLMRYERLDAERLVLWKRPRVVLYFFYAFAMNMASVFFIPLGVFDFVSLFALPVLLPISIISLAYILGSAIFMLFEPFNRTLSDRLSGSVMVTESTLDDIYRAKGYHF